MPQPSRPILCTLRMLSRRGHTVLYPGHLRLLLAASLAQQKGQPLSFTEACQATGDTSLAAITNKRNTLVRLGLLRNAPATGRTTCRTSLIPNFRFIPAAQLETNAHDQPQ